MNVRWPWCAFLSLAILPSLPVFAQSSSHSFDISVTPTITVPIGPTGPAGERLYSVGGGALLTGELRLPSAPSLSAQAILGYDYVPTPARQSLSLFSAGAGLVWSLKAGSSIDIRLTGSAGYGLGVFLGNPGSSVYIAGGLGASFIVHPVVSLGLAASYWHYVPFYQAIRGSVVVAFHLGSGMRKANLAVDSIHLNPVFPVFQTYYNDNPIGSIALRNKENGPITDVRVTTFVKQYMDGPKQSPPIAEMKQGEVREVSLLALFTDSILKVTEGTKSAVEVHIDYRLGETAMSVDLTDTLQINYRNAMTWEDDQRAASFVTPRDPAVMRYAKSVGGVVRDQGGESVSLFLRQAMGIFESLGLYGLNYVADPKSPYSEMSRNRTALDYLQFPVQTLSYKGGDCDDLSILYAALLESIGIPTAFITIPGHIYLAFGLGPGSEEMKGVPSPGDRFIVRDGAVWVPIEVTMVHEGFLRAWEQGAREWREHQATGSAALYPMQKAWQLYPPTGLWGEDAGVTVPDGTIVLARYEQTYRNFAESEIRDRVQSIEEDIRASKGNPKHLNRLGALYAQYGLYDMAQAEFQKAAGMDYLPAISNLGNIAFMKGDFNGALAYYSKAVAGSPSNGQAILRLAKVNYQLGNDEAVAAAYRKLQSLAPDLAAKLMPLVGPPDSKERASEAGMENIEALLWAEESEAR